MIQLMSNITVAAATVALVCVTVQYARAADQTVHQMNLAHKFDFLPILSIARFAVSVTNGNISIELKLKNVGKGVARMPSVKSELTGQKKDLASMPVDVEQEVSLAYVESKKVRESDAHKREILISYSDIYGSDIVTRVVVGVNDVGEISLVGWDVVLPKAYK